MISKIPTTIFTGFFGVGKTTAIRSLMTRKPVDEKWAILVNEFGEVGVDDAVLQGDGTEENVVIRDIPGGCMCCVANVPMRVAITDILRRARPDRLLIEPTGIGHPAGILDELRSEGLAAAIDIRAVICLVDPRLINDPRLKGVEIFQDQVNVADVLIGGKSDLASEEEIEQFRSWASGLYPPKLMIDIVAMGEIDLSVLDLRPDQKRPPLHPHTHGDSRLDAPAIASPLPGRPVKLSNIGAGYQGCGWIFSADDIFNKDDLLDMLGPPNVAGVERLKGVFRTGKDWLLVNRVGSEVTVSPIAYRRDSRLEVIFPDHLDVDWSAFEALLIGCLK